MAGVGAIAVLGALFAAIFVYQNWLRSSVRPREFRTQLPVHEVKRLFELKVAGMGWKVIDDDNPMVAQSSMLAGRRQEISMRITQTSDGLHVHVWVSRLWTKGIGRVPYKAHTIRMRMNAFERAASAPVARPAVAQGPRAGASASPAPIVLGTAGPAADAAAIWVGHPVSSVPASTTTPGVPEHWNPGPGPAYAEPIAPSGPGSPPSDDRPWWQS
jgi:hypothetical protein